MPQQVAIRRPHRRKIRLNILLFLATILTTLLAGAILAEVDPLARPELIYKGFPFSCALMSILLSHELGHYLMSRLHRVDATLPYFIPAPTIVGTFGAIIRMNSNVPDRRALLDIGATGPIVGFVVSIPCVIIGLRLSEAVPGTSGGMIFGSSLLLEVISRASFPSVPEGYVINIHPVALAGWLGLLVTMMNLLPVGMMDGGHIAYALFGSWHRHISRVVVVILGACAYSLLSFFPRVLSAAYAAYTVYGAGITPALLATFFWKRATPNAGAISIAAGMIVTIAWEIARKVMGDFPLGMPAIYPALICSMACLIGVSYLEPPPDEEKWKPFMA